MNFINGQSISVRLAAGADTALGTSGVDIPLHGATLQDGWLLADYQEGDGSITRYALPPASVLYVKQTLTPSQAGTNAVSPNVLLPS